jgi:hypothetical protein
MARSIVGIGSSPARVERRAVRRPLRPAARRALRAAFVAFAQMLAAMAVIAGPTPQPASRPAVSLGEVSGKTPEGEFAIPLSSAVRDALGRAKLGRASERFVLSASLDSLDTKRDGRQVTSRAVVSMALRREKEQTLHAVLRGSATAEESDATFDSARETALRAAVDSAMRRLPEAVER